MSQDEEKIQKVWKKGTVVPNKDPAIWRKDECKALIKRDRYGDRDSRLGWEIHHPGGTEDEEKAIPLQWENNVATGDGPLKCPVTS